MNAVQGFILGMLILSVGWLIAFVFALKRWGKKGWWLIGTAPVLFAVWYVGYIWVALAMVPERSRTDAKGNTIWADTPLNRTEAVIGYGQDIEREKSGGSPGGGIASWGTYWLEILATLEKTGANGVHLTDNYKLYVDYIVAHRKAAGLPDLPGHPSLGVVSTLSCSPYECPQ